MDSLLALDAPDIDVEQIKWVVLMVLFSQPGQELAYARMEDLVFEENTGAFTSTNGSRFRGVGNAFLDTLRRSM